jgi:hypothetical protein
MQRIEPVGIAEFAVGFLRNLPNIIIYLLLKLAEKLHVLTWIYPQLKNQPDLPKLVSTLETEVRNAHLPAHCVLVDIENPFIFFHLRPLIRTTKRNFDLVVKKLIVHNKLPLNTYVRKKNDLFIVLIDRNWIADNFPTA